VALPVVPNGDAPVAAADVAQATPDVELAVPRRAERLIQLPV
jgi:hypothetical protein